MRDRGHDVTVYGRGGLKPRRDEIEGIERIDTLGIETKTLTTLTHGATAIRDAATRKFDAALVVNIAHGPFLGHLRRSGVPFALNVDGLEWKRQKWGRFGRRFLHFSANKTAEHTPKIIVDSQAIGDVWRREFGVDPMYIPYGADVGGSDGHKIRNLGLEPREYMLVVARLAPENNVGLALDALELLEIEGRRPRAVIVGSANYKSALAERLERLAVRKDVLWLGHVSDQDLLLDLWANCGVYVHGHSAGGTNPALLQALGAGAPTLALDTPFNAEVVGANGRGLFQESPDDLADAIAYAMHDGVGRALDPDAGRSIVASRFTWDEVCEKYLRALVALADAQDKT
jgi:glycosyltransferase involved in cell wall biosynthesis